MPVISVILPAYNAEQTIEESIQSIVSQTFIDWELIIINDGSTDNTKTKILSFIDSRIKYVENDGNKGLIYTLNRGIDLATGKYIARMDADDICYPERFEKQVAFMEEHPEVIVCGAQIEYFGTKKSGYRKIKLYTSDTEMKEQLAINTCFAHPSVMMRTEVIKKNNIKYNYSYKNAEDYKIWIDLMKFGKFANLSSPLLKYRVSDTQITQNYNSTTSLSERRCRFDYLKLYTSEEFAKEISDNGVHIQTIKKFKKLFTSTAVLKNLYLSLNSYTLKEVGYYLFSLDFLRLGPLHNAMFLKRFIGEANPIYKSL